MSEVNFVLSLIEQGASVDQIRAIRKHYWSDGRIDMRSSAVQSLLLAGKLNFEALAKASKELDAKRAPEPTPVKVVAE